MRILAVSPCYCTECNAPGAQRIQFDNPGVVQQCAIALCDRCLAQLLRLARAARPSLAGV